MSIPGWTGGFVTLYDEEFQNNNVRIHIRVHTPELLVKMKYSRLKPGDEVKICGLVELYIRTGGRTPLANSTKVPTTIIITIRE